MPGEPYDHKRAREQRQRALYPELTLAPPEIVEAVDAMRRRSGQVSSIGSALELTYAGASYQQALMGEPQTADIRRAGYPTERPTFEPPAPIAPGFTGRRVRPSAAETAPATVPHIIGEALTRPRQAVLGFTTGDSPADSLDRFGKGFTGAGDQYSGKELGGIRLLPEGPLKNALAVVGEEFLDPINWLAAAVAPAAGAARGIPYVGRVLGPALEPIISGRFASRLAGEAAAGSLWRGGAGVAQEAGLPAPVQFAAGIAAAGAGLSAAPRVGEIPGQAATTLSEMGRALREPGTLRPGEATMRAEIVPGLEGAIQRLRNALAQERELRRRGVAGREISEGRGRQLASMADRMAEGRARGLVGEELSRYVRGGAAEGQLRRTTPGPIDVSPATRNDLYDVVTTNLERGSLQPFEYLQATESLGRALSGAALEPNQRRILERIFGSEVADMLGSRQPRRRTPPRGRAGARAGLPTTGTGLPTTGTALPEIGAGRLGRVRQKPPTGTRPYEPEPRPELPPYSERAPARPYRGEQGRLPAEAAEPPTTATALPSAEAIPPKPKTAHQRELEQRGARLDKQREKEIAALNQMDIKRAVKAQELAAGTPVNTPPRGALARADQVEAQFTRDQWAAGLPSDEQLMHRASVLLEGKPDSLSAEVLAAIEYWLAGNRKLADRLMGTTDSQFATAWANLSGNTPDSWLNTMLNRRALIQNTMIELGVELKQAKRVSSNLFDLELRRRFPDGVPDNITAMIRDTSNVPYNKTVAGLRNIVAEWKNTMFGTVDFGVWGQQVDAVVRYGSPQALGGMINRVLAMLHLPYAELHNADSVLSRRVQYMLDGVHQGTGTAATEFDRSGTLLRHVPVVGKNIDAPVVALAEASSHVQFGVILGTARNLVYEGNLLIAHALGKDITDPLVRADAAHNANAITSFANQALQAGRREKEAVGLISPAMTRAQIERVGQIANLLSPKATLHQRAMAATMIMSQAATLLLLGKGIHDLVGVGDFQWNPFGPGFGTFTIAGGEDGRGQVIQLWGQGSFDRAIVKSAQALIELDPLAAAEAWGAFLLGRQSLVGEVVASAVGFGYDPGRGFRFGDLQRTAETGLAALAPIPPLVSKIVEMGIHPDSPLWWVTGAFETLGFSTYEEYLRDYQDRVITEAGGDPDTMTKRDQDILLAQIGRLTEFEQMHRDELSAIADRDRTAQALLVGYQKRDALAELEAASTLADGTIDYPGYRHGRTNINIGYARVSAQYEDVWSSFKESDDPVEQMVGQYSDLFGQAEGPGGVFDPDAFARLEAAFIAGADPEIWNEAARIINGIDPRDNDLEQELTADLQITADYWTIDDVFYSSALGTSVTRREVEQRLADALAQVHAVDLDTTDPGWRAVSPNQHYLLANADVRSLMSVIDAAILDPIKTVYRTIQYPEVGAALRKWGYTGTGGTEVDASFDLATGDETAALEKIKELLR